LEFPSPGREQASKLSLLRVSPGPNKNLFSGPASKHLSFLCCVHRQARMRNLFSGPASNVKNKLLLRY
jgi:hypothetical protein